MQEVVSPDLMCIAQLLPNSNNAIKCDVNGVKYLTGSVTYFDESIPVLKICDGGNEFKIVLGDMRLIDSDENPV